MANIVDLPDENIGRVLDCLSDWDLGYHRIDWKSLANLNLTCRRLSALCTRRIWATFRIVVQDGGRTGAFPTAGIDRIRNVLGHPHLLSLLGEIVMFQVLPDLSDESEEEPLPDNSTVFQALSDLLRNTKSLQGFLLMNCPVDSTKTIQSYNQLWSSIFLSNITEIVSISC